jgi:hypothetical protein
MRRIGRVTALALLLALGAGGSAMASSIAVHEVDESQYYGMRSWSEAEAVIDQVRGPKATGLAYQGPGGEFLFAPDGRAAMLLDPEFSPAPMRVASLGRYRRDGNWLLLKIDSGAADLASLSDAALAEYAEGMGLEVDEIESMLAAPATETKAVLAPIDADAPDTMKLLVVPFGSGDLLVDSDALLMAAKGWDGDGPLELYATAWRVPANELPASDEDSFRTFSLLDPFSPKHPIELTSLLRRDAIEARVVEVLDTGETLKWSHQRAEVRMLLDRGANHGLYVGMDAYGLPPDEAVFAQITEVKPETAIATYGISRFSPKDAVALPTVGLRVATRREGSTSCHLDTSAAVRAKVTGVSQPRERLFWDKEGYAWFELTIDQGSAHGLMLGDDFSGDADELDGEGKVIAVQPDRATVLWRMQRYDEEQELQFPVLDTALVTPAWKRAEWDTFGGSEQ